MTTKLLPPRLVRELAELADGERRIEGLRMLFSLVGQVEDCSDVYDVIAIGEEVRRQIRSLYEGSKMFSHDYQRFDGAVNAIIGSRISEFPSSIRQKT